MPAIQSSLRTSAFRALVPLVPLLALGCAASANNSITVQLDEDFRLSVGQSAIVSSVNLEVGFERVSADSRCGKGEVCVWEGDAIIHVWLRLDGGTKELRVLHTASREPTAADFMNYNIRLVALHPPAIAGRAIAADDYVATLELRSGNFGGGNIF